MELDDDIREDSMNQMDKETNYGVLRND
jgi:hypothetical protein